MTLSGDPATDVLRLRQHATQLVDRLGLAGFDNGSILAADAWVDSAAFRGAAQQGDPFPSIEVPRRGDHPSSRWQVGVLGGARSSS
jgi:hypothetical protein